MLQFLSLTQSSIPDCTTEYSPVVFLKNKENPSKMRKNPPKKVRSKFYFLNIDP